MLFSLIEILFYYYILKENSLQLILAMHTVFLSKVEGRENFDHYVQSNGSFVQNWVNTLLDKYKILNSFNVLNLSKLY